MVKTLSQRVLWLGVLSFSAGLLITQSFNFSSRAAGSSFADPTAQVSSKAKLGDEVYVGPFATLLTDAGTPSASAPNRTFRTTSRLTPPKAIFTWVKW